VLAQDVQLDGSSPGILRLYPPAVVIWGFFEHNGAVCVLVRLDVLRDDGAELLHVVHGAEEGGTEGSE